MKRKTFAKLSGTGLALSILSAIIAAVQPKYDPQKQYGCLVASANGSVNLLTCSRDASGAVCEWTATLPGDNCAYAGLGSRTTSNDNGTSSITTAGCNNKVTTITTEGKHTSQV